LRRAIRNVDRSRDDHFDAIFVGGGSAGRQSAEQLGIEFVVSSEAEVLDARTVRSGGHTYSADALVLATGSRAALPGIEGETLPGVFDYAR
jgi:pyruvate/2-oxoglutarate dehydrogenase complex dihydrolipoamide dehydrogenase (E3) component